MKNFIFTKAVSNIGYAAGIILYVLIVACTTLSGGVKGFFIGAGIGFLILVPMLILCEMAMAVIAIAENTQKDSIPVVSLKDIAG